MSLKARLENALESAVEERVDLSSRTSMRVGGPAELFAVVESEAALARAVDCCQQAAAPFLVLGGGCNAIVADEGVRGVVFKIGAKLVQESIEQRGQTWSITLSAGQPLTRLVSIAREKSLVGMEFLAGIPGTVGGAVVMNAGTKAGSTEKVCAEIGICEGGRARTLERSQIGFVYRGNGLPPGAIVSWARFELSSGDAGQLAASRREMEADLAYRKRTQPLHQPNAGSIFRNPPGDFAARLIQDAGLKGLSQGEAQVSEMHANFIVNRGEAKAADVAALMLQVQEAVLARSGVLLIPEVKLLGEFDPARLPRGIGGLEKPAA